MATLTKNPDGSDSAKPLGVPGESAPGGDLGASVPARSGKNPPKYPQAPRRPPNMPPPSGGAPPGPRGPMAVASGGTQPIIVQVLEQLNIRHFFSAVVTSEMVRNQKPAPDIFLEAARRIGVEPQFCRAYEDTELGLQAIRAAGMEAVDVRELLKSRLP